MRKWKVLHQWKTRLLGSLVLAVLWIVPLMAGFAVPAGAAGLADGAVYALSNAAAGNEVLVYNRAPDGTLAFQAAYPTAGLGSGAGLGSQGAVILSQDHRWLFAVNAGSSDISSFAVTSSGLSLVDVEPAGGLHPISLAAYDSLLYVLNDGGSGDIHGFSIGPGGDLSPLAGSTQPLSNGGAGAAPGPAQISFTPDGTALVVTEKATNLLLTYPLAGGLAQPPVAHPSAGMTPFGFAVSRLGYVIVSEAFGGAVGLSAVSSYAVSGTSLSLISPSVATTQTAACWVALSKNNKFAYVANTGSSSVSGYRVNPDGSLTLLNPTAGLTGAGSRPADAAFSRNGLYLYVRSGGSETISAFRWQPDGSLASLGEVSVMAGSVGLAAY
jgi:6-phosphogluconolactonase (cycloisomerase 2 family)